ncbi:MAG: hypothetical protein ABIO02_01765 [Patescibacteria group bacterium]
MEMFWRGTESVSEPKPFDYGKLLHAVEIAKEVFSSREQAEIYQNFGNEIAAEVVGKDLAREVFCTGYPYYLLHESLPDAFVVREIQTYLGTTERNIEASRENHNHGNWPCPGCQDHGNLPDLKTLCKPCDRTVFRPRDIFKALPDIDLSLVVDGHIDLSVKDDIAGYIESRGLAVSDHNMRKALDGFTEGYAARDPLRYILLDFHVIEAEDYKAGLDELSRGNFNVEIPIASYRGNGKWDDRERLPLGFDYMLSLTTLATRDNRPSSSLPLGISCPDDWVNATINLSRGVSQKVARMFDDPNDSALMLPPLYQRATQRLSTFR